MGVKISELVEKTTANSSDVIPVVDTGTKKMKLSTLLSLVFPIGSTYVTQTNTNPSTILGFGTWERLKGKVVVGLDENDTDFNQINKTGGSKYIQEHYHKDSIAVNGHENLETVGYNGPQSISQYYVRTSGVQGARTGNSGNLQPYQVVGYMWIRKS